MNKLFILKQGLGKNTTLQSLVQTQRWSYYWLYHWRKCNGHLGSCVPR